MRVNDIPDLTAIGQRRSEQVSEFVVLVRYCLGTARPGQKVPGERITVSCGTQREQSVLRIVTGRTHAPGSLNREPVAVRVVGVGLRRAPVNFDGGQAAFRVISVPERPEAGTGVLPLFSDTAKGVPCVLNRVERCGSAGKSVSGKVSERIIAKRFGEVSESSSCDETAGRISLDRQSPDGSQ